MSAPEKVAVDHERQGLLLSVLGALGMAFLGIGFHFVTDSEAVLLDGLFSLIGFAVGLITMRVAMLVRRPDDEHFHFGYAAYEPMLNLAKGLLLVFVSLFAAISAVQVILDGGREIRGGMIVVYALIACAGCLAVSLTQRRISRRTGSPLAQVDSVNWLIDGVISGAVAVAFALVRTLEGTSAEHLIPYADPAVVLALVVLSAPLPVAIIRTNWRQLLGRAPGSEVQAGVRREVARALAGVEGATHKLRMLQAGRSFYLQIYVELGPDATLETVAELDAVRQRVFDAVWDESPDVGLDVIFTRDPRWFALSVGTKDRAGT